MSSILDSLPTSSFLGLQKPLQTNHLAEPLREASQAELIAAGHHAPNAKKKSSVFLGIIVERLPKKTNKKGRAA
jgi:hypothetical protein